MGLISPKDITTLTVVEKYSMRQQTGAGSYYKRRKPADSEIDIKNISLEGVYDFIRMLEDPYPNAFLIVGNKKIVFKSAELKNGIVSADIDIIEV